MFTRKYSVDPMRRDPIRRAAIPSKALVWASVLAAFAAPVVHAGGLAGDAVNNDHQAVKAGGQSQGHNGGVHSDGGRGGIV